MEIIALLNRLSKISPLLSKIRNESSFEKSPRSSDSNDGQTGQKKENKQNKPSYISFSNTVVNPGTMMIILLNANFTNLTMITSPRFSTHTFETNFLRLINIQCHILLFLLLGPNQQTKIKNNHNPYQNPLNNIHIIFSVYKQTMQYEQTTKSRQ